MFEIPDDDDSFWEEFPLDTVEGIDSSTSKTAHVDDGRNKDPNENSGKQFCKEPVKGMKNEDGKDVPPPASGSLADGDKSQLSRPLQDRTQSFGQIFHSFTKNQSLSNSLKNKDESLPCEETPKEPYRSRRKFPGPAGILPKLAPGQSMDGVAIVGIGSPNPTATSLKEDAVSSQSSEDIFSDHPWQALLKDLGDDGKQLLSKFAISVILDKARRKQLPHGKVTLMFAVIEGVDTLALDACVTLKDKSGKMQGTVHRDVLKEYESEFQAGSVLVLRQVSVLSLTSRNHYLNITPSNIVIIYQNKNMGLTKVWCLKDACSLSEVLLSLDRQACLEEEQEIKEREKWETQTGNNVNFINKYGTPLLTTPIQNRNLSVRTPGSVTHAQNNTPQLFSGVQGMDTPNIPRVSALGRNYNFKNGPNIQRAGMPFSDCRPQIPNVSSPFPSNIAPSVQPPYIGNSQRQNLTPSASTLSVLRNEQSFLSDNKTSNRTAGTTFVQNSSVNKQNQGSSKSSNSASTTSVPRLLDTATTVTSAFKVSSGKDSPFGNPWRFQTRTSPSGAPKKRLSASFNSNSGTDYQDAKLQQCGQQNSDIRKDVNKHNLENTGSNNLVKMNVANTRSCQILGNSNCEDSGLDQRNSAVLSTANITTLDEGQRLNERNVNLSRLNSEEHLSNKLESKWSFKPRSFLSNLSIGVTANCSLTDENLNVQQKTELQTRVKRKAEEDNLWQDDISDDLLSQLSDDFF
ncbi:hypothetical protein CHS0354_029632 [Potamilus streckersoni]|uniref:Homologous recombination OB-fold protein OB-fold domain-containing protein n=1 Tax=Potamilus streckersoni TaxID=2493646 RepID=A0AAE0RU40_9BIVA|nr:hypothetical protein CHS0354_029632 [Potamilus streckersoni]